MEVLVEVPVVPVSCSASAQVGVPESCLDGRASLFVTGVFYPTEYIRILHLSLRAAALSPLTLPCLFFLRGFLKKTCLPSPCYFSVGQWIAPCQMCIRIICEGLFTGMLLSEQS